jgi:glycosyltransferase involved in cell wall biosynthesis
MGISVLHLIDSGGVYGAEKVVLSLMVEQKKTGQRPVLGSIGSPEIAEKPIEGAAANFGLVVRKFRMQNGLNLNGALEIADYCAKERIDILHCHGYKANILMASLSNQRLQTRRVVTLHGWTGTRVLSRLWIYEWLDALSAKRASAVVVVSGAMADCRRLRILGLKPRVIHNGIPLDQSSPNWGDSERLGWLSSTNPKAFLVGTIGRLSVEKGFNYLVKAVAKVIHAGSSVRLVIVGEGEEQPTLERLAESLGIREHVVFAGYVPNAHFCLPCFNLFVMSSLTEGLPITLLEAMNAEVPIVATRVGGIPEALGFGQCGLLVDARESDQIAKAIQQIYESPELERQRIQNAKRRVQELFSLVRTESDYRRLYAELLEARQN